MQKPVKTVINAAIAAIITTGTASAGSFALYTESSPAAIGNYAAGIAAEAADASTGWYNPAGLTLIREQQAVLGLVGVFPTAELTGTSISATQGLPSYIQTFEHLDGAKVGYVPSLHYALPLGENAAFGLSLVSPFGLSTQWSQIGPVRYAATTSHLLTGNISPELGGKLSEHFAVGAGLDLQYARVRFNRVLGAPTLLQISGVSPYLLDSLSYNKGDSFGVGFHVGAMGMFNDNHTRLGLNYQSQMRHRFDGYSLLGGPLASLSPVISPMAVLTANPFAKFRSNHLTSNTVILPEVTTLSIYQDMNAQWALLGSVVYTGWNSLKTLELDRVAVYVPNRGQSLVNTVTTENYRNAWRFALGANYHVNEQLMFRVGGGYDQTPTRDAFRDIRVPDSNRWAASVGVHYQLQPTIGIDAGYTHLFSAGDAEVNKSDVVGASSTYTVHADIKAHADLVGLQAVWTLDQPAMMATK